jgi:hypothetical protein
MRSRDVFAVSRAVVGRPLVLWAADVDPQSYLELIFAFAGEDPAQIDELQQELKFAFGVDIQRDVTGRLSGELGLLLEVAAGEELVLDGSDGPPTWLRGALVIGLKDAAASAAVSKLVAKLAQRPELGGAVSFDAATQVLTIPAGPMTLVGGVVGEQLVLATGADVMQRFAALPPAPTLAFVHRDDFLAALDHGRPLPELSPDPFPTFLPVADSTSRPK